jgi:hypothetical protein
VQLVNPANRANQVLPELRVCPEPPHPWPWTKLGDAVTALPDPVDLPDPADPWVPLDPLDLLDPLDNVETTAVPDLSDHPDLLEGRAPLANLAAPEPLATTEPEAEKEHPDQRDQWDPLDRKAVLDQWDLLGNLVWLVEWEAQDLKDAPDPLVSLANPVPLDPWPTLESTPTTALALVAIRYLIQPEMLVGNEF